jgi:hypothetical protein
MRISGRSLVSYDLFKIFFKEANFIYISFHGVTKKAIACASQQNGNGFFASTRE